MDKASLAEWILGRVGGQQRASEIVGDLLEQQNPSSIAFWSSVLLVILALSWRWIAGIAAAATLMFFGMYAYSTMLISRLRYSHDSNVWTTWAMGIMIAGVCVWSVFALNAFRFGIQENLSKVGASLAILLTVLGCSIGLPFAQYVCPVVLMTSITCCLLHSSLRRPLLCILITAASYAGMFVLLVSLMSKPSTVSVRVLMIELFGSWLTSIAFEAWVLTEARRRVAHS